MVPRMLQVQAKQNNLFSLLFLILEIYITYCLKNLEKNLTRRILNCERKIRAEPFTNQYLDIPRDFQDRSSRNHFYNDRNDDLRHLLYSYSGQIRLRWEDWLSNRIYRRPRNHLGRSHKLRTDKKKTKFKIPPVMKYAMKRNSEYL